MNHNRTLFMAVTALAFAFLLPWRTARGAPVQWRLEDGGNGHFYEPVGTAPPGMSWSEAKAVAEGAGGYLATITSAEENAFVFSLIQVPEYWYAGGGNVFGPWIGGYQPDGSPEPDAGWCWVTGETWSFAAWAGGEPNNQGGKEDVLSYMGKGVAAPTWNDGVDGLPSNPPSPGYIVEFIPEPVTLSLLALGGLGLLRRGRNRSGAARAIALALVLAGVVCTGSGAPYPQTREYLLGDVDGIVYEGPGSEDDVYVDPSFLIWAGPPSSGYRNGIQDFDVLSSDHSLPFTFQFPLAPGETVVAGRLTVAMRGMEGAVYNDRIDLEPDRGQSWETFFRYDFSDLAWLPITGTGTEIRTIDLGNALGCYEHPTVGDNLLPLLQDGQFNIMVHDDVAIDYAVLTVDVVPEPAVLGLLPLAGVALVRRRR